MAGQNTILFPFNESDLTFSDSSGKAIFKFGRTAIVPPEPPIDPRITFLFNKNDIILKPDTNELTFVFGDPLKPCEYPIFIDENKNIFDMGCNCHYIDYDTNIIKINCNIEPVGNTCFKWEAAPDGEAPFACPCLTWTEDREFNITCDTTIPDTDIILGTVRNYYGHNSTISFSIDIVNVTSYIGFNSEFSMSVADMRFVNTSYFGIESTSTLKRLPQFAVSHSIGFDTKSAIVFDPYNRFFKDGEFGRSYYGTALTNNIVFNPYNKFDIDVLSYYGHHATTFVIFDSINRFETDIIASVGFDSKSVIAYNPYNKFDVNVTSYYGHNASSVLFYDYHTELSDKPIYAYIGTNVDTVVVFDPYHNFTDEDINAYVGFESKSSVVFDPYNEFFKPGESATATFGLNTKNVFVFNPYNKFFNNGEFAQSIFGLDTKNKFVFNPYNLLGNIIPNIFGISINSAIRYSDDQRVSTEDILMPFGLTANSTMRFANTYANVATTFPYGFSTTTSVQISPGFVTTSYFGIATNIKYLTYRIPYVTFDLAIANFGFELHDNTNKPRYFDLSKNQCCSIEVHSLHHVEMTHIDGWDVIYGNEFGWGIGSIAELCTQPRFSAKSYSGFEAKVIDSSVYLGQVEIGFGFHARSRNLQYSANIDLGNGNFIVDQNEIRVELSKPDDILESMVTMYHGNTIHTLFGVSYALNPYTSAYGHTSNVTLNVEEALRGSFWFGYNTTAVLNRSVKFSVLGHVGFVANVTLFEPPYILYFGAIAHCEALITENFVEFLEEGELENEYLYQTPNGDIDIDRPNGISIESAPYTHYIKGRCF